MADLSVETGMRLEDAAPLAVADPIAPTVVETPEAEIREPAVNPRDAAMARINENRQKVLDHELLYAEDMAADASEHLHPGEAVEPLEAPAVVEPIVAAPATIVAEAPLSVEPTRRTIQIGGQSYSVTDQELEQLAIYGAQSLSNQGQPAPQQQEVAPQHQVERGPVLNPEFARSVAKRIAFGDEEDGARALEDLVSGVIRNVQGPAVPTVDQVVQQAIPIMQARQHYADTLTRLGEEFSDVFTDTGLSTLAGIEARNLIQKNSLLRQEKPYSEVYREACQTVRDRYIAPRQSQPGPETTQTALQAAPNPSRLESKRAAPRPPASAGRTASLGIDQNRIPTGSEVVNRMRQARGQPAYN